MSYYVAFEPPVREVFCCRFVPKNLLSRKEIQCFLWKFIDKSYRLLPTSILQRERILMSEKEVQWLELHNQWDSAVQTGNKGVADAALEEMWEKFSSKAKSIASIFASQCQPYLERTDYLQEGYLVFHTLMHFYGPSALTAKLFVMLKAFDIAFRRHCTALVKKARGRGYSDSRVITFKEVARLTEEYESLIQITTPTEQEIKNLQKIRNEIAGLAPELVSRFDANGDALELVSNIHERVLQGLWRQESNVHTPIVPLESVPEVADTSFSFESVSSPLALKMLAIATKIVDEEKEKKKRTILNLLLKNWQRRDPILDKQLALLVMVTPARVSQIKREFVEKIKSILGEKEF